MKRLIALLILAMVIIPACESKKTAGIETIGFKIEGEPIISLRFVFHTGSMKDPEGKNGLANITSSLLSQGSTLKNKYQDVLKKLYPIASSYSVQVDREYTTFVGQTHKDNAELFYGLFKEALLEPAFTEDDFKRVKAQFVNYLKTNLKYGNDEELGKAVFKAYVYKGTSYEKNIAGALSQVESITLEDVKAFYKENFTQKNLIAGISGNFDDALLEKIKTDFTALPAGIDAPVAAVIPEKIQGTNVLILEKQTDSTGIHIGFPIELMRKDPDFHALFLANSWLGEHRNSSSHLYQVIREARGMNYGDYSYIEDFPGGGFRQFPPANVYKNPQLFEIWIRPVENKNKLFALRAALRELKKLVDNGMKEEDFNLTKKFLSKYYLHFASTSNKRLGFRIDDKIYGLSESHLENFKKHIDALTLEKVNQAIKKHLQYENLKIVFVTNEAEALKADLANNNPSPIQYRTPKPDEVLEEDKEIVNFPLDVKEENIEIVKLEDIFK